MKYKVILSILLNNYFEHSEFLTLEHINMIPYTQIKCKY